MTLPLMAVGGCGVISVLANLLPGKVKALVDAAAALNLAEATRLHKELFPLAKGLLSLATNPIPIKTALAMKGTIVEEFRLPLCSMSGPDKDRLAKMLSEAAAL